MREPLTPPELIAQLSSDLAPLLPLPSEERLDGLLRDQSRRWAAGERVPVEVYRRAVPELLADDETLLLLISGEMRLRGDLGETLDPEEYRLRFPQHADAVVRQIEVETALNASDLGDSFAAPQATAAHPPATGPGAIVVPGYEILGELGRGGMGVVYKAREVGLDRIVALKMILPALSAPPAVRERFRKEARNVARLKHPNIVPVFAFGEHASQMFFALEFIPGGSLAARLQNGKPMPPAEAAELVATLAGAVEYAHQQGIVHRDLKPANVLLDERGRPFVTDFGLSRELHTPSATMEGAAVGTPAYMAPEQASGRMEAIGPHTDVFGLGAILYQLLTGRPPYQGSDVKATLREAEKGQVPPVRSLNPKVPTALAQVVERALAADPNERYRSAAELETALRACLRPARWRWLAAAVAVVALAGGMWLAIGPRRAPDDMTTAEAIALHSEFRIRVWSQVPGRAGQLITEPGVLPLRQGDFVRFDLNLNRRGHVYILWIDGQGQIDPFYPWNRKDPEALAKPAPERPPIDRVVMPAAIDTGFQMEGESGLETVLVMVRSTPLPPDVRLGDILGPIPPSPLRDGGEVVMRGWDGTTELPPVDVKRGPAKEARAIDEPVLRLIAKVRPFFDQVRAVRFAYRR